MRPWSLSTFVSACALLHASDAWAQACCAGPGAVTPARLGVHEELLVGVQARLAWQLGTHDVHGRFVATPEGAREVDAEQDVIVAARVLRRTQLALLLPLVETHRRASGRSSTGGGIGDPNLSVRWDPLLAGESSIVPGIGLLAGVSLPFGRTAEDAKRPMATDATGIGAVQAQAGLALEQALGPWLVGVSTVFAHRAPRTVGTATIALAPQWTFLGSAGYAFEGGATAALMVSAAFEGDASVNGERVDESARRVVSCAIAGSYPFSDSVRGTASLFANPPFRSFGLDQPANAGLTLGLFFTRS